LLLLLNMEKTNEMLGYNDLKNGTCWNWSSLWLAFFINCKYFYYIWENKSIKLYFENGNSYNGIGVVWDSTKFNLNDTNDLFIYNFMNSDLNKNEGMKISIIYEYGLFCSIRCML
jgi:hypothetical protein